MSRQTSKSIEIPTVEAAMAFLRDKDEAFRDFRLEYGDDGSIGAHIIRLVTGREQDHWIKLHGRFDWSAGDLATALAPYLTREKFFIQYISSLKYLEPAAQSDIFTNLQEAIKEADLQAKEGVDDTHDPSGGCFEVCACLNNEDQSAGYLEYTSALTVEKTPKGDVPS